MNKKIGTIVFAGILCISLMMVYHQYRVDQGGIIYEDENGVTIREVEDDTVSEDGDEETYDITKAYYENYDDNGLETYVITGIYDDVKEYVFDLRETEKCEYIFENEQGEIVVKVTPEQREEWLMDAQIVIDGVLQSIVEKDLYKYELSEDYTELYCEVSKESDGYDYTADLILLLYNAELYQIFNGVEEWSIHVVIINMDNGEELVNVQYPKERINITPEMWDE